MLIIPTIKVHNHPSGFLRAYGLQEPLIVNNLALGHPFILTFIIRSPLIDGGGVSPDLQHFRP